MPPRQINIRRAWKQASRSFWLRACQGATNEDRQSFEMAPGRFLTGKKGEGEMSRIFEAKICSRTSSAADPNRNQKILGSSGKPRIRPNKFFRYQIFFNTWKKWHFRAFWNLANFWLGRLRRPKNFKKGRKWHFSCFEKNLVPKKKFWTYTGLPRTP